MSAKRPAALRALPEAPPPLDAEADALADAARADAAPVRAAPDRSGLLRPTPPVMNWLTLVFDEPAEEAAFVAAHFRHVYGLQQTLLAVLLVAALAVARTDGERYACVAVLMLAIGAQHGLHRLPAPAAHALNDGLWLALGLAACAAAHTLEGVCPSDFVPATVTVLALSVLPHVLLLRFAPRLLALTALLLGVTFSARPEDGGRSACWAQASLLFGALVMRALEVSVRTCWGRAQQADAASTNHHPTPPSAISVKSVSAWRARRAG